jgi:transcriptional regulator with XRE-family HTH domain
MQPDEAAFRDRFKTRFKELRGGMTQAEFAKHLGISRPTVGFYEAGERIPDAFTLKKIVNRCNVPADYLLGVTGTAKQDNIDASARTGLSDDAIDTLAEIKDSAAGKIDETVNNPEKLKMVSAYYMVIIGRLLNVTNLVKVFDPIVDYVKSVRILQRRCNAFKEQLSVNICKIRTPDDVNQNILNLKNALAAYQQADKRDPISIFMDMIGDRLTEDIECAQWKISKKFYDFAISVASELLDFEDPLPLEHDDFLEGFNRGKRSKN